MAHVHIRDERQGRGGRGGRGGRAKDSTPARRLVARLAATEPAMTALPALDTAETAVEGGRYFTTCEAAVLGLPATSVVIPASTETLQCVKCTSLPGARLFCCGGIWGHEGGNA